MGTSNPTYLFLIFSGIFFFFFSSLLLHLFHHLVFNMSLFLLFTALVLTVVRHESKRISNRCYNYKLKTIFFSAHASSRTYRHIGSSQRAGWYSSRLHLAGSFVRISDRTPIILIFFVDFFSVPLN